MTRKDFVSVAMALAEARRVLLSQDDESVMTAMKAWRTTRTEIAKALRSSNEKFDSEKFNAATEKP
jgi:hypothetical protein